ncbi:MAG: enoyl-CoA hydratase-related protein [Longimicrobiales bacterium]
MPEGAADRGGAGVLQEAVSGGVCTLTLARPDKRNALNGTLVAALHAALRRAATDDRVRVVALRGAGKDFCSGADLAELERIAAGMTHDENVADAMHLGRLFTTMRDHPRPVVAVVHGRALAGGCGLATACDLILAHEDAQFGYPEVHLGFVPAMVMAILRRKVGEGVAFDLVSGGHRIDAREAHRIGLVNRLLPAATFAEDVGAFLSDLAARPASALELTKGLLYGLDGMSFEEGIAEGAEVNAQARLTPACREGVRAFLERSAKG